MEQVKIRSYEQILYFQDNAYRLLVIVARSKFMLMTLPSAEFASHQTYIYLNTVPRKGLGYKLYSLENLRTLFKPSFTNCNNFDNTHITHITRCAVATSKIWVQCKLITHHYIQTINIVCHAYIMFGLYSTSEYANLNKTSQACIQLCSISTIFFLEIFFELFPLQ